MTVSDEADKLRLKIVLLGPAHARRYPEGLKEQVLALIDRAKGAGITVGEACRRVGISRKQVSSWRSAIRATQPRSLRPVEVVGGARASDGLAFVAPTGFRVEGVSVMQAIELMRALS